MDVIMRNDVVESVRAGDKMVFTGSLVVVPDISAVTAPGERVETRFGAAHPSSLPPGTDCDSTWAAAGLTFGRVCGANVSKLDAAS